MEGKNIARFFFLAIFLSSPLSKRTKPSSGTPSKRVTKVYILVLQKTIFNLVVTRKKEVTTKEKMS